LQSRDIDQAPLYNTINMGLRYDDPNQSNGFATPIPAFLCPSDNRKVDTSTSSTGKKFFVHNYPGCGSVHEYGLCGRHGAASNGVFAERNGMLEDSASTGGVLRLVAANVRLQMLTDGTSNIMAFSEFKQFPDLQCPAASGTVINGGWGRPAVGATAYQLNVRGTPNACYGTGGTAQGIARSWHVGGVHVLMMDGTVRFISDNVDGVTWQRIGMFDDGFPVGEF
jgi:hypothetical protein